MEEWKKIKISDICNRITSGGTPKSTIAEYYGGNIPWLNTKEINFNRIFKTEKSITDLGLKSSSAKLITINSVVVAMYGATAGKVAITKIPLTTNQACCNLSIDSTKADYRYVYYALSNDYSRLASLANGGAQQNLNAQLIKDFEIIYPSLEKQKRIANILSSLDDKIELNNRINANLEEQAQALFHRWFVDFEFPNEEGLPYKSNGGGFVESELGKIPEEWTVEKLSKILYISKNGINPLKTPEILYTNYSLPAYDTGMIPEELKGSHVLSNKYIVTDNTILFSKLNPRIKRIWYVEKTNKDSVCSTEFIPYKATINELTYFVYCLINSPIFYQSAMALVNGSTGSHQRFHPQETLDFKISMNKDKMIVFSKLIAPMIKLITKNILESHSLSQLRDTLLPKLMNNYINL